MVDIVKLVVLGHFLHRLYKQEHNQDAVIRAQNQHKRDSSSRNVRIFQANSAASFNPCLHVLTQVICLESVLNEHSHIQLSSSVPEYSFTTSASVAEGLYYSS